jgi:hypothetical protein
VRILGWSLFVSTFRFLLTALTPHSAKTIKYGSDLVMWLIGALLVVPIKAVLSLFAYVVLPENRTCRLVAVVMLRCTRFAEGRMSRSRRQAISAFS